MLQFVLGTGGTGKTAALFERIKARVKNGEEEVLVLVPDQSSFETEKALLGILGARASRQVEVFGFDGMCRHVFRETRSVRQNVIDNGTRAVLMNIALEELGDSLTLLKSKRSRAVSDMLLGTLSECKKSGISTERLRLAAESIGDQTLSLKLKETALALDTFEALLAQSYIDPLDDLARLKTILYENEDIFKNRVLFVDSFSGFTAAQLDILRILLNRCRAVTVALTLDPFGSESEDVFKVSRATYKQLLSLAKRDFVEIKPPLILDRPLRFDSGELALLEQNVFRREPHQSEKEAEDIVLYSASDIYDECAFVARRIRELVLKKGLRYRDISVICRDLGSYRGVLDVTLEKYGIPFFTDAHSDIGVKPAARLINAVFRCVTDSFQRGDVLSLLKTGLTQFSEKEISTFENYLYVWNLSGRRLTEPFTRNPSGYSDKLSDRDAAALKTAESVRRGVMEPLVAFRELIADKTGREITKALYDLLETFGVPDALSALYDELDLGEEKGLGAEQIRVWALLMDVLDKTVAAVGERRLSAARYYELLSIQISNIEFSRIPQTLDCVTVTTAQRVRGSQQSAAFLIGCADGVFPAVPRTSGLFSDYEIKQLLLNDVPISDDFSYIANLETFMAYCAVAAPSRYLFASCPAVDPQGARLKPSEIFSEIIKVFPRITLRDKNDYDSRADAMTALQPAFEEYARSLSDGQSRLRGLDGFFAEDARYAQGVKAVKRALERAPFRIEDPQNARLLFGEDLTVSASQVEKFGKCRFSYFCTYGLGIRERRRAEIDPMEYGTLVHHVLEQFFTRYTKEEYTALSDEETAAFVRDTVAAYLEGYLGGSDDKSPSFLYRLEVFCANVRLLLSHIIEELGQSDFEVADCELKIGRDIPAYTLKLPTGQSIAVCGSVDRVDIMKTQNDTFLRVIDYKTGGKVFRLSDILFGLDLQMLLYLCSVRANGGGRYGDTVPAGVLYMPAVVPNISADGLDEAAVADEIRSDFRMNGLLLDDVRVIKGMDKSENARYIPVKIKNGSSVGSDSLVTLEQMGKLFKKLNKTVTEMGERLYSGDIAAAPLKGSVDACEYCPFDGVCAYRRSDPVNVFKMKADEVFEKIDAEASNEGGEQ